MELFAIVCKQPKLWVHLELYLADDEISCRTLTNEKKALTALYRTCTYILVSVSIPISTTCKTGKHGVGIILFQNPNYAFNLTN